MTNPEEKAYFIKIDVTIKKIRNDIQRMLHKKNADLTVDQWVVLDQISQTPGLSQKELAVATGKDSPTMSRILEILSQKGLAMTEGSDDDRRKMVVFLTAQGQQKHQMVKPIVAEVRKKGWGDLSDHDYATLVRIMDSIYQNISE